MLKMLQYIALLLFVMLTAPVAETQVDMEALVKIFGTPSTITEQNSASCSTPSGALGGCVLSEQCQKDWKDTIIYADYVTQRTVGIKKCPKSNQICCPYKTRQPAGADDVRRFRTIKDQLINYSVEQVSKEQKPKSSCGIRDADSGETPWLVIIKDPSRIWKSPNPYEGSVGGGTLVRPGVVLTAAHVVYGRMELQALAGEGERVQTREVDAVKVHEHLNLHNAHNDIALLFLAEPFSSSHVRVICLPRAGTAAPARCLATQWTKSPLSGNAGLKTVDVPVLSHQQCQSHYRTTRLGPYFILDKSFLCAGGEQRRDVCLGDGGFPLVCEVENGKRFAQFGIVAWDIECGQNAPTVHMDVTATRAWIDQQLESQGLSTDAYTY